MTDLPSWVGTALDVFFYALVIPGLVACAILCIVQLISPVVFAFWGNALFPSGFVSVSASA